MLQHVLLDASFGIKLHFNCNFYVYLLPSTPPWFSSFTFDNLESAFPPGLFGSPPPPDPCKPCWRFILSSVACLPDPFSLLLSLCLPIPGRITGHGGVTPFTPSFTGFFIQKTLLNTSSPPGPAVALSCNGEVALPEFPKFMFRWGKEFSNDTGK